MSNRRHVDGGEAAGLSEAVDAAASIGHVVEAVDNGSAPAAVPIMVAGSTAPAAVPDPKARLFSEKASTYGSQVLDALTRLGGLANPARYTWTEDQEKRLVGVLLAKIDQVETALASARMEAEYKQATGKRKRSLEV